MGVVNGLTPQLRRRWLDTACRYGERRLDVVRLPERAIEVDKVRALRHH